MELTPENLQNMTPEQIMQLQKQNCIFCHIISGKVSSKKVYEDQKSIAILDINPANPGHVLLLPKEHYAIMPQLPDDTISHLFMVAKGISHACLKVFKVQGTNIFVANGVAAGQKAQHFMIHIIPRKENDGLKVFELPEKQVSETELEALRKELSKKISSDMGIKPKVINLDLAEPKEKKEARPAKEETKGDKAVDLDDLSRLLTK